MELDEYSYTGHGISALGNNRFYVLCKNHFYKCIQLHLYVLQIFELNYGILINFSQIENLVKKGKIEKYRFKFRTCNVCHTIEIESDYHYFLLYLPEPILLLAICEI